ncbi:hypothetical protein AMECASPLE_033625 [Ameca splendens]|uniref:Uncharacterized protein n=1 Tax=Ameca splendens TaxID=208324 RepID=A0ABV0XK59_9TELE
MQKRFSSRIVLDLASSIFPSTLIVLPVPAEEKHPHSMMLPPPYFLMRIVRSGFCTVSFLKTILHGGNKFSFGMTSAEVLLKHVLCPLHCLWQTANRLLVIFFDQ